jgi:hypothetical protein
MEMGILSMMNRLTDDCLKELVNIGKAESFQDLIEFQKKFPEHRSGQLGKNE